MASTNKLGWHFINSNLTLGYGDGRTVQVGVPLSMKGGGTPVTCQRGMHASAKPSDAASFQRGSVICRVKVSGQIDEDSDKFCGRTRTVLWMKEITSGEFGNICRIMGESSGNYLSSSSSDVAYALKTLAYRKGPSFDRAIEQWAKDNGMTNSRGPVTPPKPLLEEKDLLRCLMPRVARTKKEILRDIKSYYDLKAQDGFNDDRFDEVVEDSDRVIVIDNIDGRGNDGFMLRDRSR